MTSIDASTQQNLAALRQAEQAARGLNDLGARLAALAGAEKHGKSASAGGRAA
jgi:hypothetical protein